LFARFRVGLLHAASAPSTGRAATIIGDIPYPGAAKGDRRPLGAFLHFLNVKISPAAKTSLRRRSLDQIRLEIEAPTERQV